MAETDLKVTVLGAINEVRERSKLPRVTTIDQDSDSLLKLRLLNDVVSELSDYSDWQELYAEAIVSVQTSVRDYAVSGVVVQNILEVAISTRQSPLKKLDIPDMRLLQRGNNVGQPYQWALKGTTSEGNPVITVDRWPTSQDTGYFNIAYYKKPVAYTTADASATVAFPGRLVIQGLLTKTILDESDGESSPRYVTQAQVYQTMKDESYNRFNGDSGGNVYFKPGKRSR